MALAAYPAHMLADYLIRGYELDGMVPYMRYFYLFVTLPVFAVSGYATRSVGAGLLAWLFAAVLLGGAAGAVYMFWKNQGAI